MKKRILILLVLFTGISPLSAKSLAPEDFAFGIPLTVNESAPIYSFNIPKAVYQNIDRKDFGDIRIFNSSKTPVAHAIKTKADKNTSKLPSKILAFFPILKSRANDKNNFSLNINTDPKGAIINVRTENTENTDDLFYYLIDLSVLKTKPEQLLFSWWHLKDNLNIRTTLEYSHNLTDWTNIKTDTTLAELNFSGNILVKDKINLNGIKSKYLRLGWPIPLSEAKITKIQAIFPDKKTSYPLEWESFPPGTVNPDTHTIEYQIQGIFPASAVCLEFAAENTVFKAQLKSRPDKNSDWKLQYSGLFYSININNTTLSSDPIKIKTIPDRFWQLKLFPKTPKLIHPLPNLKIGWIPHDISFLNQGQAPFLLAFGNYEIEPAQNLVDQLYSNMDNEKKLSMIKTAIAGNLVPLGEKRIKPGNIPWQKWALWTILISGVCLLGIMAFKLFKQINSKL